MLPIVDITKFSVQDFPQKVSCIIWFGGCNFRCHYCHNPEFIDVNKIDKFISEDEIFTFLKSRVGLLDGVVLSGGECTLNNEIYDFIKKIKALNFLVKIDTNGTNLLLIKKLVYEKLIDFVALDYKAPKDKFYSITGNNNFEIFNRSLEFLISSKISMEIRTTIHTKILNENDINNIIAHLNTLHYDGEYAIQNFKNTKILTDIGEQEKIIDKNLIKRSENIKIIYRNF